MQSIVYTATLTADLISVMGRSNAAEAWLLSLVLQNEFDAGWTLQSNRLAIDLARPSSHPQATISREKVASRAWMAVVL